MFDEKDDNENLVGNFAVQASQLLIVPLKPTDDDVLEISLLEAFACFKQVQTTVTTTPAGTTTTSSTTTQFTTSESTTTSVVTTLTPEQPTGKRSHVQFTL